MRILGRKPSDYSADDQSLSSDDEGEKFGETLVRATKFLAGKMNNKQDINGGSDRDTVNSRFNAAKEGNLSILKSVAYTDSGGMGMGGNAFQEDEFSFNSDDESQMSLPEIDEKRFGMSLIEEDEGDYSSGGSGDSEDNKDRIFSRQYANVMEEEKDAPADAEEEEENGRNKSPSEGFVSARVEVKPGLNRQGSDISAQHSHRGSIGSCGSGSIKSDNNLAPRRGSVDEDQPSTAVSPPPQNSSGGGLLRAIGLGGGQPHRRRSSQMSTATDDSGEDNKKIQRWFGSGFRQRENNAKDDVNNAGAGSETANSSGVGRTNRRSSWIPAPAIDDTSAEAESKIDTSNKSFHEHHVKSRANFTKRHLQSAASENQSFRIFQQKIRDKGAVTANSIAHLLQEAAEEHAVRTESAGGGEELNLSMLGEQLDEESLSKDGLSIDLSCLDNDSESGAMIEQRRSSTGGVASNDDDDESSVAKQQRRSSTGATWRNKSTASLNKSTAFTTFNESMTNMSISNIAAKTLFRRTSSLEKDAQSARKVRIEMDPIFGPNSPKSLRSSVGSSSSDARNMWPYITIPSRETEVAETLFDAVRFAAEHGQSRLVTIHGRKFVGKTRLCNRVIDTGQIQGLGYTVLSSTRSSNDILTSFFSFREIVSTALRACDAATQRSDESLASGVSAPEEDEDEDETDESIVRRLINRKILNKNDQLMIGRILPGVMNNQLLSLLKGRNPGALIKDIAASVFKIMIPLQPAMLVFEAQGNDCDIDLSSWNLIEELLLSAGKHCPQMLMIVVSRHSLVDDIPQSISDKHVDVHIERMDTFDTECYIRAIFCGSNCIDRNMKVDSHVVDGVYDRAKGCPLFTERIVLWAKRNKIIDLDERRNAVGLMNFSADDCSDSDIVYAELTKLPHTLNEELLEVINNLPDYLLDALKLAACIGITFDINKYECLKEEGLHASLQKIMSSLGIFDVIDGHLYQWRHVSVYEAVESIIIFNERVEIQGQIADSLRDLSSSNTNDNCAQYARHSVMADRWEDAFDRYMDAGDKAETRLDYLGAVSFYQQAKVCLSKSPTKPTLRRRLSPYAALGWCLRELVRYDEAEMELEYCLEQTTAVPERRKNKQFEEIELDVITTLATLKQAQSKYLEAIEMYERALPIARANQEMHSKVWLAHHVASCAEINRKSGNLEQAKTLHMEALGYREEAVEEKSCTYLELSNSFTQLGCTLHALGDYERAFGLHKKALAARVEHLDFYHALVSESLNYCADALQALKKGRQGIPLAIHAVKIRHFIFGPRHPAYAHALSVLASCYHEVGRSFDALDLLKECLEVCEIFFSDTHANLIPNLMLYGSVLNVAGDSTKALEVYNRALDIHVMNFKDGKNVQQLIKLQKAINEISSGNSAAQQPKASLDMPIPSYDPHNSKTNLILCVDIGSRATDEYMLSVAAALQEMGSLNLVSVIAVSPPQVVRANIARGALDSLLLSSVPVAYSGVVSASLGNKPARLATYNDDYGKPSAHVNNTGVELIIRALKQAPEKSLVILCTSCLGDISDVIDTHRDLFASKVKQVVIIGSVKPVKRNSFIEPEEHGGKQDAFAQNVYESCQELEIPTATLYKGISLGFPFPSSLIDNLASSNHMLSTKLQESEEARINGIWEKIKQLKKETRGFRTPSSKAVDIKSFCQYSLGGQNPSMSQHSIWPLIKSIDLELVLGLLSCFEVYQDTHFRWDIHQVNGVEHKICRQATSTAGIIKPEALSNEIHMLIEFSLRTSLLNTSC